MRGKTIPALLITCCFLAIIYAPVGQRAATSHSPAAFHAVAVSSEGSASGVFRRLQELPAYGVTRNHEIWINSKDLNTSLFPQWQALAREYRANLHVSSNIPQSVRVALNTAASASPANVLVSLPAGSIEGALSDSGMTQPPEMAKVTGVSIIPGSGKTTVYVATTKPVQFKPFQLADPVRLVVDLQKTVASNIRPVYASQPGVLKEVRVAQFSIHPSVVTRVVADLSATTPSTIESAPRGVRIQLQSRLASGKVGESVPSPAHTIPEMPARTQTAAVIAARPEVVDLTRPVNVDWGVKRQAEVSRATTSEPSHISASPANLMADASIPPQAQQAIRAAQVVAGSSQTPEAPLESTILSTPSVQPSAPIYTGKLISLDLKAVDIRDFFRLIHQISGLNIVVDSDVTGRVTLVLDDVPWDQALDLVLKNNDLGKVLEGNVLRIAKVQTLTAEAQSQATLREAKLESEPLVTIFRRLKYAHASDQKPSSGGGGMGGAGSGGGGGGGGLTSIPGIASILKSFQKGTVLSERGNIVEDPRDNAVIITDVPSQIPVIESVINKLDTKSKQVSIQVRVILANADFSRTLSTVLGAAYHNRSGSTSSAGGTGQGITGTANVPSPLPPLSAITQPASVGASGFGAFAITNAGARYAINAAISAAETHDQARTISRPTIVTQDNVLGEVQQGVQIPIQTNINNTIAVQYVNATLMLSVTPQVTVDNKVFMNIYVNNASIGTISTFTGPSINTQQATTQVLVPNGGTVVFGGITVTTRGRSATYIPLLGSIPVIGNLFKSSQVNDQNQELLFFVTPMVLPG